MGLFKQMRQAKDVTAAAPDRIQDAQATHGAQIDAARANEAALGAATAQAAAVGGQDFEPVAGVSIETYAAISRTMNERGAGQGAAVAIAAEHGVEQAAWETALAEWNARMQRNPPVGTRFGQIWRGEG